MRCVDMCTRPAAWAMLVDRPVGLLGEPQLAYPDHTAPDPGHREPARAEPISSIGTQRRRIFDNIMTPRCGHLAETGPCEFDLVIALALGGALLLAGAVQAQQPAPAATPSPPPELWSSHHQRAGQGGRRCRRRRGEEEQLAHGRSRWSGRRRAGLFREDGRHAESPPPRLSQAKARTAVHVPAGEQGLRRSIRRRQYRLHDLSGGGAADRREGGVPIVVNGKIIGAIGVSGGTGQQDGDGGDRGRQCGEVGRPAPRR